MSNNANLIGMMTFDEMLNRLQHEEYYFDESGAPYGETFTSRDISNFYAVVSRDGAETARVELTSIGNRETHYESNSVPFAELKNIFIALSFDVEKARWDDSSVYHSQEGDGPGYIYVMKMEGTSLVKIGRTKHHTTRTKLLGVLMPLPCSFLGVWQVTHMRTVESILHRDYSSFHSNGEWFDLPGVLDELITFMDKAHKRIK